MVKLDVFKLAEQVNKDSKSGAISQELLLKENVMYGLSHNKGRLTRLKPNGEFSEGVFQDGKFVIGNSRGSYKTVRD